MRTSSALVLLLSLFFGLASAAKAQDGVSVRILNDTPDDLLVTLYDRTVHPPQRVLSSQVINGNAAIRVTLTADASGRANLSWTAVTVDRDMRRCGRRTLQGVNDENTVHVFANHRCPRH